jgi:nicotinate-nucleotide adenylyltransferase
VNKSTSKEFPHKEVVLFFGSFNPIHIGHLAIANYMVEFTGLDELWFVVTPKNPHKKKRNLLNDYDRLELVQQAICNDDRLQVSDIEFFLTKPSYTVNTLAWLKDRNPNKHFRILIGSDNLESFHKWKNYEAIMENYGVVVYPRPGFDRSKFQHHKNILIVENAPQMDISSSFVRKAIRQGKDVRHFLPPKTWEYIEKMGFYR